MKTTTVIDAGIEHIHIKRYDHGGTTNTPSHDIVLVNNDRIIDLLATTGLFKRRDGGLHCEGELYITGKLSEPVKAVFNSGISFMSAAALWSGARYLLQQPENAAVHSLGILEMSASGYMCICLDRTGELVEDSLVVNPRCGAGSGINLNRILEKLDIKRDEVDRILSDYIGEAGKSKRASVPVRADRCGVFSSSATISDKNQGISLDFALATTMKSEVLKSCKKMTRVDTVYLTGRIFNWMFARDCAADYFQEMGIATIAHDSRQEIIGNGIRYLVAKTGSDKLKKQNQQKLRKDERLFNHPPFAQLKETYEKSGLFTRIASPAPSDSGMAAIGNAPVTIGLDVGSTMAKMTIADATGNGLLFYNSYDNHGDTIATIKYIFSDLKKAGINIINIQHIGITGSGRYQVQKSLRAVYPHLAERIFTLVENYAHARGSLSLAKEHIARLKHNGVDVNEDFCTLVDIGGEDTKISIISLKKDELFDNAMNIKCSAGTGSLMDTLKTLFGINRISEACAMAFNSPRAYGINATCAVFLMENARTMQAMGYGKDEILASCNYAIVENMARSLWDQVEIPANSVVLLHGQTMLSDPLPLAVTHRMQEYAGSHTYCLVPPLPGHRACLGLLNSITGDRRETIDTRCDLDDYIEQRYEKKIITCRGAACGDKDARCARTRLISTGDRRKITLTLGGCSAVNELQSRNGDVEKITVRDSYREIWDFINDSLPKSERPDRLVLPRSFAVSEQAFFISMIFHRLGLPVHCDTVTEQDVLGAQSLFTIDTCAPNIGATGQFIRLAAGDHGLILVPQIDYLPTDGVSLGRSCTTNQGGVVIARHFAEMKYPEARFHLFTMSLKNMETSFIANQLNGALKKVFDYYSITVSGADLADAIEYAIQENKRLMERLSDRCADYVEYAIQHNLNMSIVCAREYLLNPGIYDSHVGRLLKDKGVIAIPAYACATALDEKYRYMYWRNPHDLLSKMDAIANKRFNEIIIHPRLKELVKKIEKGLTNTLISVVQVSTFRCGPDTVTSPTITEITKNIPSLFIQSDAMIKELAHLENRVNTHLNQLDKGLHDDESSRARDSFSIEILDDFAFDGLNRDTDVLYFPTLGENRMLTAVLRAAGITAVDNYDAESYDLVEKVKTGRKHAGDSVCAPLSAVFADIIFAVDDFVKKKNSADRSVHGKNRVQIFMVGGDGPCRLGQYVEMLKLYLHKKYKNSADGPDNKLDFPVKILINMTSSLTGKNYYLDIEKWAGIQGFHSIILQAVLHSIFLKAGGQCAHIDEYSRFKKEYAVFIQKVLVLLEHNTRPGTMAKYIVSAIEKYLPQLGGVAVYFGYGLYNNNGLRSVIREFSRTWIKQNNAPYASKRIKIHVDGEVYMRVAQIEEIFKTLVDSIGFNSFELGYTPIWFFLEYILENRILVARDEISRSAEALARERDRSEKRRLRNYLDDRKKFIADNKSTIKNLRTIFAAPLYKAAGIDMPAEMATVLEEARPILPSLKPHGELAPYVGEAVAKLKEGVNLFINAAPEGCMVSSMGEILTPKILDRVGNTGARVQNLFSLNGEINDEVLRMALLKTVGPDGYYADTNAFG